jgi:hypothetical protein
MFCASLAAAACCGSGTDLKALAAASRECGASADRVVSLSGTARSHGEAAVEYGRHVQDVLAALRGDDVRKKLLDPGTFAQLKSLVDDSDGRAQKALEGVGQMDDLALACGENARDISDCLRRAVDALPAQLKDELAEEEGNQPSRGSGDQDRSLGVGGGGGEGTGVPDDADDDERALAQLLDVDENVADVESSTRGVGDLNLFSVAMKGRGIFEGLSGKNAVCTQIFERIRSVATTISTICSAFAGGNCCAQLQAVTAGVGDLVKCIRLSDLIVRAAEAASKLVRAIVSFFRAVGDKFRGCLDEFNAAKKIGNFVKDHNPIKFGQSILNRI